MSYRRISLAAFFAALLILGGTLFRDYGITYDELAQRAIGRLNLRSAEGFTQEIAGFADRHYGPAFEMLLVVVEHGLRVEDLHTIVEIRHAVTFLCFVTGVWFLFRIVEVHLRDWRLGLLAAAFLCFMPRVFTDGFYNTKDIPFLTAFSIAMFALMQLLRTPTPAWSLLLGLASGVAIDVRVAGVLIPALALIVAPARFASIRLPIARVAGIAAVFLIACAGTVVALWPYLWADPAGRFAAAYGHMAHFPHPVETLYAGRFILPAQLPWHYLPIWIAITTPPVILACGVIGLGVLLFRLGRPTLGSPESLDRVLFIAWFFVPPVVAIAARSSLYNGWRHMFFLAPVLAVFACVGCQQLFRWSKSLRAAPIRAATITVLSLAMAVQAGQLLAFTLRARPHGYLYFNAFVGGVPGAVGRFEMDYWGLSFTEALSWLAAHDGRDSIRVQTSNDAGRFSISALPGRDRSRILFTDKSGDADYFISNYRGLDPPPSSREVYSITVDGAKVATVFAVTQIR